jgi:acetyl esterase/lipase
MPAAIVLISAMTDLALSGESYSSRAEYDPLTSHEGLTFAVRHYIGDHDSTDAKCSPLYADLHGMPPLLIHIGDHEVLLSDSVSFAERAGAAGVDVELHVWPEMWHVFHAWAGALPEGQHAIDEIGRYLRDKLHLK